MPVYAGVYVTLVDARVEGEQPREARGRQQGRLTGRRGDRDAGRRGRNTSPHFPRPGEGLNLFKKLPGRNRPLKKLPHRTVASSTKPEPRGGH